MIKKLIFIISFILITSNGYCGVVVVPKQGEMNMEGFVSAPQVQYQQVPPVIINNNNSNYIINYPSNSQRGNSSPFWNGIAEDKRFRVPFECNPPIPDAEKYYINGSGKKKLKYPYGYGIRLHEKCNPL